MDDRAPPRRGRIGRAVGPACALAALALTILALTDVEPLLPDAALDGSWRWAVAAASARHLRFGTDFAFTFGPLGMLYSGFRLPEQDALVLGLQAVLAAALFAGFLAAARPGRRPALLLLPVALAASLMRDAALFLLPFALLIACLRPGPPTRTRSAALLLVAGADGLLPLVKGTATLPVAGCTLLACLALARGRPRLALLLPLATAGAGIAAWAALGQAASGLPAYFGAQAEVAAGYTDAMSMPGPAGGIALDLAAAATLTALCAWAAPAGRRWIAGLGCALVAFVAFKAGFVRDDGHRLIAASALLLVGLLLALADPAPRRAALTLAIGVAGWAALASPILDVGPGAVAARLAGMASAGLHAAGRRARKPGHAYDAYRAAERRLSREAGLPADAGPSDIYTVDQALLLASGLPWRPRPVVQSYSAYTPALAALNAAHLEGEGAPRTLFFTVESLDDRFPTLDDGASWPAILSRYSYRGAAGGFLRLVRGDAAHPATVGPAVLDGPRRFGEEVALPTGVPNAWARFAFDPPAAGRLAALLFRRPPLMIDVMYRTGARRTFRLVAGEAEAGFLLSPAVDTAERFAALKLGERDALGPVEVASFRLRQGESDPLWGEGYRLTVSPLEVAPDPSDVHDLDGTAVPGPPLASLPSGGVCAVDAVAGQGVEAGPVRAGPGPLRVEGWGAVPGAAEGGLRVALAGPDGATVYGAATRVYRAGLAAELGLADAAEPAFEARVDARQLHGAYAVRVVQDGPDGPLACPGDATVVLP